MTTTTRLELSSGSGIDISPGHDWQAFTGEMFRHDRGTLSTLMKIHGRIGLVAGQLVLEHIEATDSLKFYDATNRFARESNPPIMNTSYFMEGVEAATQIERAKEAIAA